MNVKDLVPKHKSDDTNIDKLYELSDDEIEVIIYDLLEWIQDYNWPIADKVLKILLERENLVFPYIGPILEGDDLMWKYWIMDLLIPNFSIHHKNELKKYILKFVNSTDNGEDTEALRDAALKCYTKCFDNEY